MWGTLYRKIHVNLVRHAAGRPVWQRENARILTSSRYSSSASFVLLSHWVVDVGVYIRAEY